MTRRTEAQSGRINRRRLLKIAGAGTVGLAASAGSVSAHPPDVVTFWGCSKVCVESSNNYRVLYANGDRWGYRCSIEPGTDELAESEPNCFEAGENERIMGVLGGQRNVYWNPNSCTTEILDGFSLDDCAGCSDDSCSSLVNYEQVGPSKYEVPGLPVTVWTLESETTSRVVRDPEPAGNTHSVR